MGIIGRGFLIGTAAALVAVSPFCSAQTQQRRMYDLPPQELKAALRRVTREAGYRLLADATAINGKKTRSLRGEYTPMEAIEHLLEGFELSSTFRDRTVFVRGRETPSRDEVTGAADDSLVVTGSRIRGATPTSPVIALSQDDMRNAGQTNLGDAMRALPQSFGGGQNPGVGIGVSGIANTNLSSGSSLNLRGLGPDATLTLLNGKRLAYNSAVQSVDLSIVPFGAVDRVEIVADGASALYGSDAVGGVANIILKRDFDGVLATARLGGSTDGGNQQQQYSATAGTRWNGGGVIVAYDYSYTDAIKAKVRSYADALYPTSELVPAIRQHNVLLSAHQRLTEGTRVTFDSLFSKRNSGQRYGIAYVDYRDNGYNVTARSKSFVLAPTLELELPGRWSATFGGSFGKDQARYGTDVYVSNAIVGQSYGCYCNSVTSLEANAEGPLLHVPAGDVRLAAGIGYRSNRINAYRTIGPAQTISESTKSRYGYGELFVPLAVPSQDLTLLHRLELTGALRYEDYDGFGSLATPKLGLLYAPSVDVDFKLSWGKSFKAPTLFQLYSNRFTYIYPVAALGGANLPQGATALYRSGGNPDLTAERATSWSTSVVLHPTALQGLHLELSYFSTRYRNRIVQPISSRAQALSNPIYSSLIKNNPSDADKAEALDVENVYNNLTIPYNSSSVVAIVDSRFLNVTGQRLQGVDLNGRYGVELAGSRSLTIGAAASYLESRQQVSSGQPLAPLVGTLFNPPHWRGRTYATWKAGHLSATGTLSYIGGVSDRRSAPAVAVGPMKTFDFVARYAVEQGPLAGTEFGLTLLNAFNDKPSVIKTVFAYLTPYDSTNYSPSGRFLGVSISKRW